MNTIKHKWFYEHSPKKVWEYLTKAELIAQWLMQNDFLPVIGHEFTFRSRPLPDYDFDGIVYCKVVEIIPYKKLSYTWKSGPGNGVMTLDTLVSWSLSEKNNGTELQVEHSGFNENETLSIYSLIHEGWLKNIQKITALLDASITAQ